MGFFSSLTTVDQFNFLKSTAPRPPVMSQGAAGYTRNPEQPSTNIRAFGSRACGGCRRRESRNLFLACTVCSRVEEGRREGAGRRPGRNLSVMAMLCMILKLRDRFSRTRPLVGLGLGSGAVK